MHFDYDDDHYVSKPFILLPRGLVAFILALCACLCGYWYLHFTEKADAFTEGAHSARGEIVEVTSHSCGFTRFCVENQRRVYVATVAFKDRSGRSRLGEAEFRWRGRQLGDRVRIQYLAQDPTVVIAGDLEFAQGMWSFYRIRLAIGAIVCGFFAIAYWLPKGMLVRD